MNLIEVKEIEGSTIPWGVETAIEKSGTIPDVIYHKVLGERNQ